MIDPESRQSGYKLGCPILNGRQQAEQQPHDSSAQCNDVRKNSMMEIDENQDNDS